jgi:hypothetical protein
MAESPTFQKLMLGVVIILIGIAVLLILNIPPAHSRQVYEYLSTQGAPWAQAVLSALAVLVAAEVGRTQVNANRKLELERRAAEDIRRLVVIDSILGNAAEGLAWMWKRLQEREPAIFLHWGIEEHLEESASLVQAINLFECPAAAAMRPLTLLPRNMRGMLAQLRKYNAAWDDAKRQEYSNLWSGLWNSANRVLGLIAEAQEACQKELIRLKAEHPSIEVPPLKPPRVEYPEHVLAQMRAAGARMQGISSRAVAD